MIARKSRVIVCGSTFGQFYLAALQCYPDTFDIVGLLGADSQRSRDCASRLGIACYHDIAQLPADIDIACVVLRSTVMGGDGSVLAQQLMAKGINVIQEHPIHHDDVVANLRYARQYQVQYRVGNLYPHLPAVQTFIQAVQRLKRRQTPQFIDAACASQVAFPLVAILLASLGPSRPWHLEAVGPEHSGPFQLLCGQLGGVPLTLRIHNEVCPEDPDNHAHLLHQITLGFPAGRITLLDTQGPVAWNPRLHLPQSVKRDFDFSAPQAAHLMELTSETLGDVQRVSWREALSRQWPQAIATDLLDLHHTLTRGNRDNSARFNPQNLLTQCQIWQGLTQALGYPQLRPHQQFQPVAFTLFSDLQPPVLQEATGSTCRSLPAFTQRAEQLIADVQARDINAFIDAMDTACLSSMLFSLQQGGVLNRAGHSDDRDEILHQLGVAPQHQPLISRWLTLLVDNGQLQQRAGRYVGTMPLSAQTVAQAWQRVHHCWDERLGSPVFIDYLHQNAQQLLPLMRAEQQAALLLFPEGTMHIADAVYRHTITARYLNTLLADWISHHVVSHQSLSSRPLQVLEIGAGTGATTEQVCQNMQAQYERVPPLRWIYSDVSPFFLVNARERYATLPWMSFRLLNIDQSLVAQGVAAQSIDVLVMAGVLNNAQNSEQTVRWLAEVLVPGGVMLLTEPTREHLEILTSQAFMMPAAQDDRQRSGQRFLTADQWCDLFTRVGLKLKHLLPEDNHRLTPLGQRLFIVRRPQAC